MDVKRWLIFVLIALLAAFAVAGCQPADTENGEDNGNQEEEVTDPSGLIQAWAESTHSVPVVFAAERDFCASCHDGRAFAQNVMNPSDLGEDAFGPYVVATDCRACHTGRGQEVLQSGQSEGVPSAEGAVEGGSGAVCMECHNQLGEADPNDEERGYPHYGPQADVLNGTGGMQEGLTVSTTEDHFEIDDTCVGCHMAVEEGAGHSFAPSEEVCAGCHDDFDTAEALEAGGDYDGDGQVEPFVDEVQGLMDAVQAAVNESAGSDEFLAEGGEIVFMSGEDTQTVETEAYSAAYNWVLIDHDGSRGIHNPAFTITLLQETYRQLTGGDLPNAEKPDSDNGSE